MLHPRDLETRSPIWTLDLTIAGATLRYSSSPVVVDGEQYRGGLPSVVVEEQLDLLSQEPQVPSVSIGLLTSDPVARWISEGHRIEQGDAELRWQVPGAGQAKSEVAAAGRPIAGSYGAPGESLALTVEPVASRASAQLSDSGTYQRGSIETGFISDSEGKSYPLVFGSPVDRRRALLPGGIEAVPSVFASKALPFQHEFARPDRVAIIVLASGWIPVGTGVRIAWRGTTDPTDEGDVAVGMQWIDRTEDELGQKITTLNLMTFPGTSDDERTAKEWYVDWTEAEGSLSTVGRTLVYFRDIVGTVAGVNIPIHEFQAGDTLEYLWYAIPVVSSGAGFKSFSATLTPRADGDVSLFNVGAGSVIPKTFSIYPPRTLESRQTMRTAIVTGSASGSHQIGWKVRSPPTGADDVSSLGALMLWLAQRSGQKVALDKWSAIVPYLALPVAGVVKGTEDVWEFLLNEVLPLAPVSLMAGEGGIRPVLWRWWATADTAEFDLTAGRDGVVRLPDIRAALTDDEIFTEVALNYANSALTGGFRRRAVLTRDPYIDDGSDSMSARRAFFPRGSTLGSTVAGSIFGSRRYEQDSLITYSSVTADWFCRWRLAASGWSHRVVEVEGRASLGTLPLGAVGLFTDEAASIKNAVCFVIGRRRTDNGRSGLRLAFLDSAQAVNPIPGPTADSGPPWRLGGPILPEPQQ